MTSYRLFANCDFCEEGHALPFAVSLDIDSTNNKSVAEIYMGKKIPGDIVSIMSTRIQCSSSGKFFVQGDKNQIYMMPTG